MNTLPYPNDRSQSRCYIEWVPGGAACESTSTTPRMVATHSSNRLMFKIIFALVLLSSIQPTYSQSTIEFSFEAYDVAIRFDAPFGIVSLKSKVQASGFAHLAATDVPSSLPFPLAEWEWFWLYYFSENARPADPIREKVMVTPWQRPIVKQSGDWTVLNFEKPDVFRQGIVLQQDYHFNARTPEFDVHYIIHNNTGGVLRGPYVMVGFPGFMNHRAAVAVETSKGRHEPDEAFSNFFDESVASGLYQYTLSRHDVFPKSLIEELRGSVTVAEHGKQYTLMSTFTPDETIKHVYSAHTNKQLYLTSHLYVFFEDIPPEQSRSVVVKNVIESADVESSIATGTWGEIKMGPANLDSPRR